MFKLKFKQKMKPNFLLCLTLRRKDLDKLSRSKLKLVNVITIQANYLTQNCNFR